MNIPATTSRNRGKSSARRPALTGQLLTRGLRQHGLSLGLALLFAGITQPGLRALIPEPDQLVYGTITLDGTPVTAGRSDVVVEARRLIADQPVARYRMGSSQQAGNFYALRIPIESQPPLLNPNASLTEESLFIVVIDAAGIRSQAVHSIGEPGSARRLDFGAAIPDADGDGLPDAWELLHFGTTTPGANTTGVNGQTAGMNYIAGTNPNDTNSLFRVSVRTLADNVEVSFNTVQAQGPGYEGRTRYYGLEHASDPAAGWSGVTGFTNILANNLPVVLLSPATNGPVFYRGQVWLSGP